MYRDDLSGYRLRFKSSKVLFGNNYNVYLIEQRCVYLDVTNQRGFVLITVELKLPLYKAEINFV